MWNFDMNRCSQCPKLGDCPDRKELHAALHALTGKLMANEGGSRAGTVVLVCREPDLLSAEQG